MKRTLRVRREELFELATVELASVNGASTPYITDGHHCYGSSLCGIVRPLTQQFSLCECPTR